VKVVYSENHKLHAPPYQIIGGVKMEANENPKRVENILNSIKLSKHEIVFPRSYNLEPVLKVHSEDYISFIEEIYSLRNKEQLAKYGVIPDTFSFRIPCRKPNNKIWMAGWYCFDTTTPILKDTFQSAISSVHCALTGADLLFENEKFVYALCRPPGHHAGSDYCGGYCYFNNVAIAAKHLHSLSSKKVAILDIDYHHGNGTQQIFYESDQVFFISIHADPNVEYPYFWGYSDEVGNGEGEGRNLNIPLPIGTEEEQYIDAIKVAMESIIQFMPEFLIISLGVDTLANDPVGVGGFKLLPTTFSKIGKLLSLINKPTLIVQEGGYLLESIDNCIVNFLNGIEGIPSTTGRK
jgi:acetoin utilization deacetylase AcuC-like enzyme